MNDSEFIAEVINRLLPDTTWHGDSYADLKSLESIDIVERALKVVWKRLFEDLKIPGQVGNASAESLMEKKKNVLIDFIGNELQYTLCEINMFAEIYHEEAENTDDTSKIN
jgi:hypothetical protein